MPTVKPFCAVRPEPALAAETAALPYDVYHRAEAKAYVETHPRSFLRIDRPETLFGPDFDMYSDEAYETAARVLRDDIASGVFLREASDCFYLYEQTWRGRTQTGLVALCPLSEYDDGTILRHENTLPAKEEDRIRHIDACDAQTGPIFLTYRSDPEILRLTEESKEQEALYDFATEDGVRHRAFLIREPERIRSIREAFTHVGHLYIADGHHRAASAARLGRLRREAAGTEAGALESDWLLAVLFPDEELTILDYNRVVKDLNGLSSEEFLRQVGQRVEILSRQSEAVCPVTRGQFSMLLSGSWYRCAFRDASRNLDPVLGLDVSLLQNQILEPVLGISDPATDPRIDFVGGIRGLETLENRCAEDCAVAFAMYPTSIGELEGVADAGRLMPPKSTWFEPKLRSGLFIHDLD